MHPFFKHVLGHYVHATSIDSYQAINKKGSIQPNAGQFRTTIPDREPPYYYCQSCNAISLLDLKNTPQDILFPKSGLSLCNWKNVFTYHSPTIVLLLNLDGLENNILPTPELDDIRGKPMLHIFEAEVCYQGEIPIRCVTGRILVEANPFRFKIVTEQEIEAI